MFRSLLKSLMLLLLLVIQNPASCLLQAEHDVLHRGAGTSFSLATAGKSGSKQVHMQVCITIGCCHHVCRQFLDDSTTESQAQELAHALAPFAPVEGSSTSRITRDAPEEEQQLREMEAVSENVALVPSVLEWTPRDVFSPSIKFLRVLNTGNSTWIGVAKPVCTDEQFSVQEIESSAIAPGESLTIPVVFIPRRAGAVSGKIILKTSAGTVSSQLRGEGNTSPYQASIEAPSAESEAQSWKQIINFRNPHDEALEIEELQVWPRDSYNKAVCLSEESDGRIISCFADGFPKAYLSDSRYEKYSHREESISLKPLEPWRIEPGKKIHVAELEMKVTRAWSGLVYMKFSRNGQGEVLIFPMEVEMMSSNPEKVEAVQRSPETKVDRSPPPAPGPGKWMPTSDLVALKVAEALLKDLSHTLLRQSQIRKGSLTANRREPSLVLEDQVSFPTVQTGLREKLWINLVNPTSAPLLVNLILPMEVKSRNCRYRANWFWQGQHPQLHRESSVFSFEAGAQTEATLPGQGKVSLGPLTFQPKHRCDWSSLLFVKNNSTGLEWIPVRGTAGSARLEFVENGVATRRVEMVVQEEQLQVCHQAVVKTVLVRNAGDLPLQVYGMDLSEAPGVAVREGTSSFSLQAGETTEVEISYQPDFQRKAAKQVLKVSTSLGVVKLPVIPRLSRGVVSLCRNSSLQERLVLPVSICALVLVMGVFFWLLLKELSAKRAVSSEKTRRSTWKESWTILVAGFRRRTRNKKAKVRVDESGVVTLKTFHQDFSEKCKLRKKKKMRSISTSSPRSQSSSSAPGSPHSGSDTELQLPAIERILNSTRFSEVRAAPKKTKTRISVVSEEVAIDRVQVEAAWNSKLGAAGIPSSKTRVGSSPSTSTVQKFQSSVAINHKSLERSNSTSTSDSPQLGNRASYTPTVTPAPAPAPVLVWELPVNEIEEPAARSPMDSPSLNRFASGTTTGMEVNQQSEKLYDIWGTDQLRLHRSEAKQQRETLYDIWGDHLSEIFTAFSSPDSPDHFSGNNQSFFSQTPHSGNCSGGVIHNSPRVRQQLDHHALLPNSEEDLFTSSPEGTSSIIPNSSAFNNFLGFLPQAETCTGLPEPHWKGSSMYRLAVPEIAN